MSWLSALEQWAVARNLRCVSFTPVSVPNNKFVHRGYVYDREAHIYMKQLSQPAPGPQPALFDNILVMNKPKGHITSAKRDPELQDTPTILEAIPQEMRKRVPLRPTIFGRLDVDTTGLLLLGAGPQHLTDVLLNRAKMLGKLSTVKTYEAVVSGTVTEANVEALLRGVVVSHSHLAKALDVQVLSTYKDGYEPRSRVEMTIDEGVYHQVKQMFFHRKAGRHRVKELKRIRFGEIRLGKLAEGDVRLLTEPEKEWMASAYCERLPFVVPGARVRLESRGFVEDFIAHFMKNQDIKAESHELLASIHSLELTADTNGKAQSHKPWMVAPSPPSKRPKVDECKSGSPRNLANEDN